jgi:hypothetical protein
MFELSRSDALVSRVAKISRGDRWLVYRRLQELMIPCRCPEDGTLWVEIQHCLQAILLRSTVQHLTASRSELVDWLERCWDAQLPQPLARSKV